MTRASPPLGKYKWTPQDEDYLQENWGKRSVPTIAKNLNRTTSAVVCRARRLQLGPVLMAGDYVTLNQLIVAVCGSTKSYSYHMESWAKKRGLPVHTKRVNKSCFRVVYLDEFWEWAKQNRSFLDFSKFEPLILGKEPAWVAEQRKKRLYRLCSATQGSMDAFRGSTSDRSFENAKVRLQGTVRDVAPFGRSNTATLHGSRYEISAGQSGQPQSGERVDAGGLSDPRGRDQKR